jgi:hypothetical protein
MLASYLTGLIVIVLVAVAWVGVQLAWRKTFPDACSDPDVLAGRMGCHGCDSAKDCGRQSESAEEEFR